MKKLFMLVAVAFALTASVSAQSGDYSFLVKLGEKPTFKAISNYIGTSFDQYDAVREILQDSSVKMEAAIKSNDETAVKKALYFNLANMRAVLSKEQYRKYLAVLNASYNNQQIKSLARK